MATLTINTTAAEDARLVVAFGEKLNLGRNATAAEIKQNVVGYITGVVAEQERNDSIKALITSTPISPT